MWLFSAQHSFRWRDSCTVDDSAKAAARYLQRSGHGAGHLRFACDIGLDEPNSLRVSVSDRIATDVADNDFRAQVGQTPDTGHTEPGTSAGDQKGIVLNVHGAT